MNNNLYLYKISNDTLTKNYFLESFGGGSFLYYNSFINWYYFFYATCELQKIEVPSIDGMTNKEYFLKYFNIDEFEGNHSFFLIDNNIPVCIIRADQIGDSFSISYETHKSYRLLGYATIACELIEEYLSSLFSSCTLNIVDLSYDDISTKIAYNLGYSDDLEYKSYSKRIRKYK